MKDFYLALQARQGRLSRKSALQEGFNGSWARKAQQRL